MCALRHPATHNRRRSVKADAKSSGGVDDSQRVQSRSREAKRSSQKLLAWHPETSAAREKHRTAVPSNDHRIMNVTNTFVAFHMTSPNAKKKKAEWR